MKDSEDKTMEQTDKELLYFKSFHELMTLRVDEILLVSSPYDAFIMQEDGRLSERIIHEYRGLNLSRPPRLTWVSSGKEAFAELENRIYDIVIVMPHISDIESYELCEKIKTFYKELPVYYFAYDAGKLMENDKCYDRSIIDRTFIWSGNTDLLMALVKNREDFMNVDHDTELANVRVVIFVEDSPLYISSLLPYIYKEIVMQTQAVMDDSLNEKDRILRMRARPKILLAENYEDAWRLYQKYSRYLLCVISDVRYPKDGREDAHAGLKLLRRIKSQIPDLPLLMLSSETENREQAENIPAFFLDKNSPALHADIRYFLVQYLGFGDFMFRLKDGSVVARASNLRSMSTILHSVPDESITYHAARNDFSRWFMARFEMRLAAKLRSLTINDFKETREAKDYLIRLIRNKLKIRQKGLISDFVKEEFDAENDFVKIGRGSLGGKARGLAFISNLFREHSGFQEKFSNVNITLPKIVVITTEGFDDFERLNNTREFLKNIRSDEAIKEHFKGSRFPEWLSRDLKVFLNYVKYPLAVRSSAILEDAHYRPSAGAYSTYMLANNHPDIEVRLKQLLSAIKLVYASIYQETPRLLAKNSVYRPEEDKMAVIIQQLSGTVNGNYFYPAISGVAQSYNFYPVSYMKPDEGVAHIALGLGKIVVDGGVALRFSPRYPEFLPQFSSVDNILKNAQRYFYALELKKSDLEYIEETDFELEKLDVDDVIDHKPVKKLLSTYFAEDNRVRDFFSKKGYPVLTFASVLKFKEFPLGEILSELLEIGKTGMGCPVEIEFAVNLLDDEKPEFSLLQIRPMMVAQHSMNVDIKPDDLENSYCYSDKAMGSSQISVISHIIYVKPEAFDTSKTIEIAEEIDKLNSMFEKEQKLQQEEQKRETCRRNFRNIPDMKYLLIGPGRWGTTDRWLGIPVKWSHITRVGTIIETVSEKLNADPSQGSHFFHNITSLGINYLGVPAKDKNFIDWNWLDSLPAHTETRYLRYLKLDRPSILKIDGRRSTAVLVKQEKKPARMKLNEQTAIKNARTWDCRLKQWRENWS
ncbi:PpsA1 [Desulfamplus magnetovallimortis]|uniref:PpsA1 n=1 Tax=Desulfamplus magnetovallimortis TaxID=1246637 RepID=A0A1W1HGM6_9BACT|nr:PEP/pyruvate-binding domain-containing protein [Desulfamplus magnetovallimortis]SLM31661.1 PpsA1 [Desulfamplus magnetovallimortis]